MKISSFHTSVHDLAVISSQLLDHLCGKIMLYIANDIFFFSQNCDLKQVIHILFLTLMATTPTPKWITLALRPLVEQTGTRLQKMNWTQQNSIFNKVGQQTMSSYLLEMEWECQQLLLQEDTWLKGGGFLLGREQHCLLRTFLGQDTQL